MYTCIVFVYNFTCPDNTEVLNQKHSSGGQFRPQRFIKGLSCNSGLCHFRDNLSKTTTYIIPKVAILAQQLLVLVITKTTIFSGKRRG